MTAPTADRYEVRSAGWPTTVCETLDDALDVKAGLDLRERHSAVFAIMDTGEEVYLDLLGFLR